MRPRNQFRIRKFSQYIIKIYISKFTPNIKHPSDFPESILKVNFLNVACNITSDAYSNGKKVHNIHSFFPAVPPGFKIIEMPSEHIYLPISTKSIDYFRLCIVDQDGDLVNFCQETARITLHLKSA